MIKTNIIISNVDIKVSKRKTKLLNVEDEDNILEVVMKLAMNCCIGVLKY